MIHPRYSDTPHHELLDFKVGEDSTGSVGMLGLFHTGGRENPKKKTLPGWVKAYIPGQTVDGGGAVRRVDCRS